MEETRKRKLDGGNQTDETRYRKQERETRWRKQDRENKIE